GPDGQPTADAGVSSYRISEKIIFARSVASDDEGNFRLTGLLPGAYLLNAYALGYVAAETSTENEIHRIGENVTISLVKGGVITGRVTDETGEPLVGVGVLPKRLRDLEGKTTSLRFAGSRVGSAMTDDRGVYRIYGLQPGVYIVSIGGMAGYSFDEAQISHDAPTYYPSATRDTAAEINLRG